MTQALYRKWRPQKWDEVLGQEHIIRTLRNAITTERVVHAYLFSGARGTGKTTVARLLAKAVNCLAEDAAARPCNVCAHCMAVNENRFLDLIEIDAASNTSVEDVRDLRDKINFVPTQGKYKIYIIDEVHMLSTAAFNALLKTLEEPPRHAIFVLATTEIHKIPVTVLSRCQRHEFRRLPVKEIIIQLKQIVKSESLQADEEALILIARQATGSMRDAISLLDQLASTGEKITLDLTQTVLGTATSQTVLELIESIHQQKTAEALETIRRAMDAGIDPRTLARQIVEYLRDMLFIQLKNEKQVETTTEIKEKMKEHASVFTIANILRMMRIFNVAATDLRGSWEPSLSLELALTEILEASQPASKTSSSPDRGTPTIQPKQHAVGVEEASTRLHQTSLQQKTAVPAISEHKPTSDMLSLDQVAQSWKQIRGIIKPENPTLDGLLNSCKLLEVKDGTLFLGFASELLCSKMDKPEQIEIARKAIAQVMGVNIAIHCVVTNAKKNTPPDLKQDGMVATALQAGGEIVDIQE